MLYPEVFDTALFFPLQRQAELRRMMQVAAATKPRVVMEIGADKGGGLYHWCKCHPTVERVIACEVRGTPYWSAFQAAFPHIDFLWLPQSSYSARTVNQVEEWLKGDRISCLFIDGDKSAFLRDFAAYERLVRRVVFLHDIQDSPGPKDAFMELKRRGYKTLPIVDTTDVLDAKDNAHGQWLKHWNGRSCGVGVVYV